MSTESENLIATFKALPDSEQPAVAKKLTELAGVPAPSSEKNRFHLWVVLLIGLFVIALAALIGAIILVQNKGDASALLVVVSAVVAGTIGLFAKSPAAND